MGHQMLKGFLVAGALLIGAPAHAQTQTHWWQYFPDERGNYVCKDRYTTGRPIRSPAEDYARISNDETGKYRDVGIREVSDWEVWISWSRPDGKKMISAFFRELDECQVHARGLNRLQEEDDRKLDKFR
jgi:hypothetical protein